MAAPAPMMTQPATAARRSVSSCREQAAGMQKREKRAASIPQAELKAPSRVALQLRSWASIGRAVTATKTQASGKAHASASRHTRAFTSINLKKRMRLLRSAVVADFASARVRVSGIAREAGISKMNTREHTIAGNCLCALLSSNRPPR
eukprot:6214466-Pleurochrysis_carterae.AAC.3